MTATVGLFTNHFNNRRLRLLPQQRVGDLPPAGALCENKNVGNSA